MIRYSILLLFVAVTLFSGGCSEEKKKTVPQEPPALPVDVIVVDKEKIPLWIEYTGKTEASKRIEVRARVAGRLDKILFDEGDYVTKGDLLFEIEKDTYEAALARANAQMARDRATLTLALKDVERYKPLVAEDLAPRVTLEQYEARVAELDAVIEADLAKIREAELSLSYTDVVAPISGRISRRLVDVGNIVGYGEQTVLTTIVEDDPMYAYFNPTENQFQIMREYKVKDQMDAMVIIPQNSDGLVKREPLSGKVNFTDNRVDRMTGTITMRAEVANPDNTILEGTFVYVEVMVTDQVAFLAVPPSVVQEDQKGSYVYIVDRNSTAKRVDIKAGYENRHLLLVIDGLQGGVQVVASGFAKLQPGTKLAPKDATESRGVMAMLRKQGMIPGKE